MTVITNAGRSSFSLAGTYNATLKVARCWGLHTKSPGGYPRGGVRGKSGGGPGGAFN